MSHSHGEPLMHRIRHLALTALLLAGAHPSAAQYTLDDAFPSLPAFSLPVEIARPDDGTDRLFIVQQRGKILIVRTTQPSVPPRLFLDLSDVVSKSGGETGLLGLAFHPSFVTNRTFYVSYTSSASGTLRSVISRFTVSPDDPDSALRGSELPLLTQDQPYENHNGGRIAFTPEGYLMIALGDGGSGNDPQNNGQSRRTLLGKLLRIDVDTSSPPRQYGVPPSNPFAGNTQGFREEIYAYGLRNPWKFSHDPVTGTLWAGDVGQSAREEIDTIVSGGNYGWRLMEGNLCTPGVNPTCADTAGLIRPVWEYGRSAGDVSVTGGFVYRGSAIPTLQGRYIYGDFASGRIWALTLTGAGPATNTLVMDSPHTISTFGVDRLQELYVASYAGGRILRLMGPATDTSSPPAPVSFAILENYPNPFNASTTVRYQIPSPERIRLSVVDALGREVALLADTLAAAGVHEIRWNAAQHTSGAYYIRLQTRQSIISRPIILMR